jgi:hypothetical protein
MGRTRKTWLTMFAVVGLGALATATPVRADFRLRVEDTGTGAGPELTPMVTPGSGMIHFNGSIGSLSVGVTTAPSGSNHDPELDLSNSPVTGSDGDRLRSTEEDTDNNRGTNPFDRVGWVGGIANSGVGSTSAPSGATGSHLAPSLGADPPVGVLGGDHSERLFLADERFNPPPFPSRLFRPPRAV